jgi:hypothetical protein
MVRTYLIGLMGMVVLAAGCGHNQVSETLPPPRFSGPTIAQTAPRPLPSPRAPANPGRITSGVPREWIPHVPARPWGYIVIHHSATPSGGAAKFDRDHRERGFDELGYHFVIGNGTETRNGLIEVGPRWPKQKWGAHARTPDNRFNEFGIGICLVGNFDVQRPTTEQMKSLSRLVAFLMKTYHISPDRVLGHGDTKLMAHVAGTDCPGHNLNIALVRRMATQMLADSGAVVEPQVREARGELLHVDDVH